MHFCLQDDPENMVTQVNRTRSGPISPPNSLQNWKRSFTSTSTWPEHAAWRSRPPCSWMRLRLKSGSKTEEWNRKSERRRGCCRRKFHQQNRRRSSQRKWTMQHLRGRHYLPRRLPPPHPPPSLPRALTLRPPTVHHLFTSLGRASLYTKAKVCFEWSSRGHL